MSTETKKVNILLVDDDKFLLNMYSLKFSKYGLEVNTACGGEEALRKLRDGYIPDIFVLDLIMPEMDGFTLLENIKKENITPNSVIILLTNQSEPSDIERAKKLGVHGYIVKATTIPSEVVKEVMAIFEKAKKK
ncbi:MAG: response regulator [Candidatus Paceibacterota bacterium]|jgi:CheY-like chemotaxis protein